MASIFNLLDPERQPAVPRPEQDVLHLIHGWMNAVHGEIGNVPTPMKPPNMTVAPSGIIAAASAGFSVPRCLVFVGVIAIP
jgi:hypothetical protein